MAATNPGASPNERLNQWQSQRKQSVAHLPPGQVALLNESSRLKQSLSQNLRTVLKLEPERLSELGFYGLIASLNVVIGLNPIEIPHNLAIYEYCAYRLSSYTDNL